MSLPESKPRRFTVIASGLLCGALAVVVIYTRRSAFSSPLAVVVVAAIGSAAVLLQLRARNRDHVKAVRAPTWLNILGIVLALVALFADRLRLNFEVVQFAALGAVGSFGVSSAVILHAFRKDKASEVSK
jgi:ABC-type Mn2+/Zn2+ transport system permease subunit